MKTKLLFIIAILVSAMTFGQKKLADKFYDNFAYIKAAELYEIAYDDGKGDDSKHVLTRLGNCYYNNNNSDKARIWFEKAVTKYDDISAEFLYKYIQVLRSLGEYEEANNWLKVFNERASEDSRFGSYTEDISIYTDMADTTKVYVKLINLEGINTEYSDFGSFMKDNSLIFASNRDSGGKVYKWNEQPYLDIYQASVTEEDSVLYANNATFLNAENVNTDYHEASVAITQDGQTMYFTRDNVNKRNKLDYDKKGTSHLKIYKASLIDGQWSNIEELPFNDDVFSNGHPALSPDEKQLYFVSDREKGIGQTDIYVVDILEDNEYSEPRNLGPKVNTEGREMFPFIAKDSTLYFSSDGYLNLGMLDIFKSGFIKGDTLKPKNLKAPYNSRYDDFAFFINSDTKQGFLSSNRPNGQGNDDIYSFSTFECKQFVYGVVRNSDTMEPIEGATVQLINSGGLIVQEITTGPTGEYNFEVKCNETYTVRGSREDYRPDEKDVNTTGENEESQEVDLYLSPLIVDNQIVINPIFFDFDKWNIRTDAKYELENIVDVMRQHPTMVIKIESHTDSRGSDRYNEKLSDRRAKSTRDYIISRGIAKDRIESAIGYGEYQLLNECADGVKCSEEKHQENRRSYFYIVKD